MSPLETGQRIANRYVLLQRIGDGGHAAIWLARDTADDSLLALKFPHAETCQPDQALAVLRHEAFMAAALGDAGVLRTGEAMRDGDRVFLPMEYATGGDLKALRGASYLRIVPVLIEVAGTLATAHARGFVHRDIKPGNVLFDARGAVRIADFGTAAQSGSTGSMAPGSPFTASPQQLCGEPAQPADDIYGLGALAYELLSGYPPYYPEFDLTRVVAEMPPLVRPLQPAPPRLVHLVMDMLARSAADRPADLQQVIESLRLSLTDTLEVELGGALIEEARAAGASASARTTRAPPRWPLPRVAMLLAIVLASLVLVLWLTRRAREADQPAIPVAQLEAVPGGEALLQPATEAGLALAADELQAADRAQQAAWEGEISAAQLALSRGQPAAARIAFERAERIVAGTPQVQTGLAAVARLERVLALHSAGLKAETAGDRTEAVKQFDAALRLEPGFVPSQEARTRIVQDQQREASEAAALAARREREATNARDEKVGRELEAAERWNDAATLYQAVLDRDPALRFARDGLPRARIRAALSARLQEFIDRPARLSTPQVRRDAERALAAGRAVQPPTPQLSAQVGKLTELLGVMDVEARVQITSDNLTRVSINRIGNLGAFSTREVSLRPGSYVVIGTRDGYRDVRHELRIEPGQRSAMLSIECRERI